jgi:hypothetical protein
MADLDISQNIFTADGSLYFKSKIAEKKPTFLVIPIIN